MLQRFSIILLSLLMGVSFLYAQESLEEKIPWLPVGNERYEPYGTLKAGPFRIHPFASEQVMWFDNIFLQQRYRESDFLSVTELGARADLIYDQKAFLLNLLKLKYNYYLNHSEASNFEYSYRCEGRYCLSRLLSFDGRAEYSHIVEPTEVLFAEKVERDIIDVLLGLDIKTTSDKLSFRAEVQEKNYNFSEKIYDAIDHNEFYFNGLGRYKYSEKTNFGARLGYGMLTYPEDVLNDHSYFTLGAFAEGELWTKVKYFAELGFLMQMVDVKNNPDDSEYTGPYCGISAQYIATEKWVLKAAFQRRIEYHAAVNYQVVDKLEGDFQWKIRPKIMLHLRCALELFNPSGDDPDIAAFGWRTIAGAACYYRIKDYLYAGVDYEHTRRLSHMELASYYANKFYIHITLAF